MLVSINVATINGKLFFNVKSLVVMCEKFKIGEDIVAKFGRDIISNPCNERKLFRWV